jgi:thiol-disulfide isomerase/thioredoxin
VFWRCLKIGLLAAALSAFATAASIEVVRQRRSAELERIRTAVGAEELPPAAPLSFALPERGGGTLDLAQLKGKVVVVTFWASWCPPCRADEPSLRKLSRRFSRDSFQLVAVSVDDGWAPVD